MKIKCSQCDTHTEINFTGKCKRHQKILEKNAIKESDYSKIKTIDDFIGRVKENYKILTLTEVNELLTIYQMCLLTNTDPTSLIKDMTLQIIYMYEYIGNYSNLLKKKIEFYKNE